MPSAYAIRGKPLPFLPPNPRWAFVTSITDGSRMAAIAERAGLLDVARAIDAETAAYRWRRFRSKQMRLLTLEKTCADFMKAVD